MTKEIYCPFCKWTPDGTALWSCLPVCGHVWNTFDTGGQCPKCAEKYEHTQCLRCQLFSLHKSWYHDVDPALEQYEEDAAETK